MPNRCLSLLCSFGLSVLLTGAASAESLLVITPVVNEILGNMKTESGKIVFIDCNDVRYDPAKKEVRKTQDTCGSPRGIVASFSPDKLVDAPVFTSGGDQYGNVTAVMVDSAASSLDVTIQPNDLALPPDKPIALSANELANWEKSNATKIVVDSGYLKLSDLR